MSDVTSCVAAATPVKSSWRKEKKGNFLMSTAAMENFPFLAFTSVSELYPLLFN